jgi:3-isopropylmalate/(R)-2-methylmalate dehydratase small subunit
MKYAGRVHRFGDDVDTDLIIPARYLGHSREDQAKHAMADVAPEFVEKARPGDVIVAGRNFGCGSARPAHRVLQDNGISCVIAPSFATLFLRNSINEGLALFKCPEAAAQIAEGAQVEADLETGRIRDLATGREYRAEPLPEFLQKIVRDGGLVAYAREKLREQQTTS